MVNVTDDRARTSATAVTIALAIAFLAAGIAFGHAQNVWIDETTQLAGAALPIGRLLAWLAGGHDPAVAVPPDRAPPLSYLVDLAWSRSVGGQPFAVRLLHLALTFAGTAAMLVALARRRGAAAVVGAAVVLYLSPRLVEYAVEIRPYPLFIALTCVQIVLLAGLVEAPSLSGRRLVGFAIVGLLAVYTHFFGLVSTMALFGGLFAARVRHWREGIAIVAAAVAVLVVSVGLKPFVTGASAVSLVPLPPPNMSVIGQFVLKLVGQPVTLLSLPLAILFFAGIGTVIAAALLREGAMVAYGGIRARGSIAFALIVALVLGLAMPLVATALPHGFDPLKPTYSLWVLPLIAWLVGSACARTGAGEPPFVRRLLVPVARGGAATAALASAAIQVLFVAHAGWFVHGPDGAVAAAIGPRADGVAIVYRGDWGYGYFPALWRYGGGLRQWVRLPDGTLHRLVAATVDPRPVGPDGFADDRRIVMVDIVPHHYQDLRPLLAGRPAGEALALTAPPPGFTLAGRRTLPGLYWTTITTYAR